MLLWRYILIALIVGSGLAGFDVYLFPYPLPARKLDGKKGSWKAKIDENNEIHEAVKNTSCPPVKEDQPSIPSY